MTQVILGKSRVREICMPGSVRAKAKWLSYSTIGKSLHGQHIVATTRFCFLDPVLLRNIIVLAKFDNTAVGAVWVARLSHAANVAAQSPA
jgi:hypothetical protein